MEHDADRGPSPWINRRGIALDPSVPRPDFIFPDVQSLGGLIEL